jgi:hypothetical protein
MSNVPGTIPTESVHFAAPVVVGKTHNTWDALTSHFESSLYISTAPQSAVMDSSGALQASQKVKHTGKRTVAKSTSRERRNTITQAPDAQPVFKATSIQQLQQSSALTALTSCCHSHASLIINKYTLNLNHSIIVKDATELMYISLPTPQHYARTPKRRAIVLNYETTDKANNQSGIAHISAIDYLTGETLINASVLLTQPISDYCTRYSEMLGELLTKAIAEGKVLNSWPEARTELWKHIDANTILVGHALRYCLAAIRMQHARIVDTAILAANKVGLGVKRSWSLTSLCSQVLNMAVDNDTNVRNNSLAGALAVRRLVMWWICHPFEISQWADRQQKEWYGRHRIGRTYPYQPEQWIWSVLASTERNPFSD